MTVSDEFLLRRRDEIRAQEMLLMLLEPICAYLARQYFGPGLDFDDLCSWAHEGALKAVRDYRPGRGASFRTFGKLCIERSVITGVKTANRGKHTPLNAATHLDTPVGEDGATLADILAVDRDDPQRRAENMETLRELADALREMPDMQRRALVGRANGETYAETAVAIGRNPKAVDNAIIRGTTNIARRLAA